MSQHKNTNGQGAILAVDLGTDGIKAAICDHSGRPETIRSMSGEKRIRSSVYITPDGKTILGEDAYQQGLVFPGESADEWKMELGNTDKAYFKNTKNAEEVATLAIKELIKLAEKQTSQKIKRVVFTTPANFPDRPRQAGIRAFEAAGLEVVQVITEPGAAGFAYCCNKRVKLVLCVDVGAGTTDVSVLEVDNGVASVKATGGIPKLGGRDFTSAIEELLILKMSKATGKSIARKSLTSEQAAELKERAEKAKGALGAQPGTKVALRMKNETKLVEITQAEYEKVTQGLVDKILACVNQVRVDAKLEWTDVEMLVLAGGPCQSGRLQVMIADHTGLVPKVEIDPAIVVAHGAALHAHNLAVAEGGGKVIPNRPLLQEATGHDIGVAVEDETKAARTLVCDVVVPKNTPVPAELPKKEYRLPTESSTEAFIEIVQGPHNAPIEKCSKIGVIHLKGLPREPLRTYRIEVVFKFDSNGMCEVTGRDNISGISQTVSVKFTNRNAKGGSR